jgi:hypothetical protein
VGIVVKFTHLKNLRVCENPSVKSEKCDVSLLLISVREIKFAYKGNKIKFCNVSNLKFGFLAFLFENAMKFREFRNFW